MKKLPKKVIEPDSIKDKSLCFLGQLIQAELSQKSESISYVAKQNKTKKPQLPVKGNNSDHIVKLIME